MRQTLSPNDEPHLLLRSLSVDYHSGAREPRHSHRWNQLLFARSGTIRLQLADEIWMVAPGWAIWVPAHCEHSLEMSGPVSLRTLYMNADLARSSAAATQDVHSLQVCPLLAELIVRVCEMGWLDGRVARHRQLYQLFASELADAKPASVYLKIPCDPRAFRLTELFTNEGLVGAPMTELCKQAGLSRRTAERLFRRSTGLSPARWRRLLLLSRALEALIEGRTVEDAAELAGYRNRAAFSQALSRVFGRTPGAARRKDNYQATP